MFCRVNIRANGIFLPVNEGDIMDFKRLIYLIALLFAGFCTKGQDKDQPDVMLVKLRGKILNVADSQPIPYVNIVNARTHSGTITNVNGIFTFEMLNIDTLVATSIGFERAVLKVPYNYNELNEIVYYFKPVNYGLNEVKVLGERKSVDMGIGGKPVDIPAELRGDAFNEAPPILAAFFNPVSYWQYYLSKREKEKRKVRETIQVSKNWEMHSKNYNKDMVRKLTGLNELQADSFMIWFNALNILPYTSTEYQVRASIIEYFKLYQIEQKMK